jgi:SAM-dependent methyltransferase
MSERQTAPTLDGIRFDHVARYRWATRRLELHSRVVDFACGVGYGSKILHDAGHEVFGYDRSSDAIEYARRFYPGPTYEVAVDTCPTGTVDAAVCFETLEHVPAPTALLRSFAAAGAELLLASVPNEDVIQFDDGRAWPFHLRHYTRAEFRQLLTSTGWGITALWGQLGRESDVEAGWHQPWRTLVAVARRAR